MNSPRLSQFGNPHQLVSKVLRRRLSSLKQTFHKRPLPANLIPFSSVQGKILFREALDSGGMESYFPLSEQFITQSDPSYCSLSTLAMVLNALKFDPKKTWKGIWRWVSEETLQCDTFNVCGHSLDKVRSSGMNFDDFESLARCHGVNIQSVRCDSDLHSEDCQKGFDTFKHYIIESCTSSKAENFIVVNFSRKSLGQTGGIYSQPDNLTQTSQ